MATQQGNRPAALVTGAGTRLGSQFATHLAQLGYDIALHCNRSQDSAREVVAGIEAVGAEAAILPLDFAAAPDAGAYIAKVRQRFPRLSCLVNSASAYDAAPIAQTTAELLEQQFRVNLFAPFFLTQAFAHQVASGQVINIIDNKAAFNQYHYAAYLLAKKSLADFTRMAAMEYAPRIRINGIAPGVVLPMASRKDDYLQWRTEGIPLQHTGEPGHLLSALEYLLSNDFVCGQILYVDGGETQNHIGRNAETYAQMQSEQQ